MTVLSFARGVLHNSVKFWLDRITAFFKTSIVVIDNLRKARLEKLKISHTLAGQGAPKNIFRFKSFLFPSYTDTRWHQAFYNGNGISSDNYMPNDLFHISIEHILNPPNRCAMYEDKNIFDKFRFPCSFPRTFGRIMRGKFLSPEYSLANPDELLGSQPDIVIKPSLDTWGGLNVIFRSGKEAAQFAQDCLKSGSPKEYIFQEPVVQSDCMSKLSPDSVNTLRMTTMYIGNDVFVLSTFARLGRNGLRTDNITSGGMACGVTNGYLEAQAYDLSLMPIGREHPDTKIRFEGYKIIGFKEAEALCIKLHSLIPELGLISWDVAFDKQNKPLIIELNVTCQDITLHQVMHGPVLERKLPEIAKMARPKVIFNHPIG
ncbi:MAG: sugar-transfer associated ATP-grasp domain-containing protein [Bdellovibrionales bacterium]